MATVLERTVPGTPKRMLLIGVAGLVLGGLAGGLVGLALDSAERPALVESAPAITSAPVTDIEAVRAQNYEFRAPAITSAPVTDIEAVRAQNYEFQAKSR